MSLPPLTTTSELTPEQFGALARQRLHREAPEAWPATARSKREERGDFDLNPHLIKAIDANQDLKLAAVLVPVIADDHLGVLLTQRTDHLPTHAGQISFPGGKLDEDDKGFTDTALREAEEEIGLPAGDVDVLGFLDCYRTSTGYVIVPVVGLVRPGFNLHINEGEVESVFEVPLDFLMDEDNHQLHTRFWRGAERTFYAMPYGERFIWGATAGILKNMYERLYA